MPGSAGGTSPARCSLLYLRHDRIQLPVDVEIILELFSKFFVTMVTRV